MLLPDAGEDAKDRLVIGVITAQPDDPVREIRGRDGAPGPVDDRSLLAELASDATPDATGRAGDQDDPVGHGKHGSSPPLMHRRGHGVEPPQRLAIRVNDTGRR